jgi:hypothetical protein
MDKCYFEKSLHFSRDINFFGWEEFSSNPSINRAPIFEWINLGSTLGFFLLKHAYTFGNYKYPL